MLKNVLIVVDDKEKSIEFYKDLFGLQVLSVQWHIERNTYQIHILQAIHLYQNPQNTVPSCY